MDASLEVAISHLNDWFERKIAWYKKRVCGVPLSSLDSVCLVSVRLSRIKTAEVFCRGSLFVYFPSCVCF